MVEDKYTVSCGVDTLAKDMNLNDALIFIKALMMEYYMDACAYTIKRQKPEEKCHNVREKQ